MEGDGYGRKEETHGDGQYCRVRIHQLSLKGLKDKEDSSRQCQCLQETEAHDTGIAQPLIPNASNKPRQVVVEAVRHHVGMREDVLIEGIRRS